MATLSPEGVYAKARHLHVDLAAEPFLLSLIKQAVVTPLPPQWSEITTTTNDSNGDTNHTTSYRNEITGDIQTTHPADPYFLTQIQELRRHFHYKQDASENQTNTLSRTTTGWMEFEGHDATKYYYDFVSQTTQTTRPKDGTRRTELQPHDQQQLLPKQPSPTKIFEHAASLHKKPSMKNLASLEILCFTSWWTESALTGSTKSYLQLYFSIATRHFQIVLDDSDDVFTISHIAVPTSGRVVSAWDLHVGARLQLLGRWTTLMQPSLLTRQWLDLHETQFKNTKLELEKELLKYELQSGKTRKPMTGTLQCADPHKSVSGVSLRQLIGEMETLKSRLAKYRPDVARRFVIPYEETNE